MLLKVLKNTVLLFVLMVFSCGNSANNKPQNKRVFSQEELKESVSNPVIVGANQTQLYLPLLKEKSVGIVANQTSVIFKSVEKNNNDFLNHDYFHLVDSLLSHGVKVKKVFAPEHGFRGTADAGELIKDGIDTATGIPIVSLYGSNKKPSAKQLEGIDIIIFDIQDVGARFYTYISTLHYVMEACAENNIPLLVLDRPNPNGHYIDGPVLEQEYKSFVGMHPVPVVHGLTIGEYAQMINGEKWLANSLSCDLKIIPVLNYNHKTVYSLPIKPSPNLPNDKAINLYPSLCLFEGTTISVGRGTSKQFQVIGSPNLQGKKFSYKFIPKPNEGAKYPKHQGTTCYGYDLSNTNTLNEINLKWLIDFYNSQKADKTKSEFFNDFFTTLAGTAALRDQIENGFSESEIKASWQKDLMTYKKKRQQYLLYSD